MGSGSPVAVMLLFSLLALCAVLFAIPALRSAPPGISSKRCTDCNAINRYNAGRCKKCGGPVVSLDDDDPNDTDQDPKTSQSKNTESGGNDDQN